MADVNAFGAGVTTGLNYYTKFAELQQNKLLDEQRIKTEQLRQEGYSLELEEKKKTKDVRMASIEAESSFQTSRAEREGIITKEYASLAENRREAADVLLESNKAQLDKYRLDLDTAKQNAQNESDGRTLEILANTIDHITQGNQPASVLASQIEDSFLQFEDRIDIKAYLEPEISQAWERVTPSMEAGDFESIAKNHPDALTTIFQDNLNFFKGKEFVKADGKKGIIQSVSLTGGFNPIPNSLNTMVEGEYSVLFDGETEPQKINTFLPDNARTLKSINEDTEGVDAKAVSIADIVDSASARKDLAMMMYKNPKILETFNEAIKGISSFKGSQDQISQKVDAYTKMKDSRTTRFGVALKSADKARENPSAINPESDYLQALMAGLPTDVTSRHIEWDADMEIYQYKPNSSISSLQDDYTDTQLNLGKMSAEVESAFSAFEEYKDKPAGLKPLYEFNGMASIQFNKKRPYVDATLSDAFGEKVYDSYKERAAQFFERAYPGKKLEDASDSQYLHFLEAYITQQINLGR